MKTLLFVLAFVIIGSVTYGASSVNNTLDNSLSTSEWISSPQANQQLLIHQSLNVEESCQIAVDIEVKTASGLTLHIKGRISIQGVSCQKLMQSLSSL